MNTLLHFILKNSNYFIKYTIIILLLSVLLLVPDALLFNNSKSLCVHKLITNIECPFCGMTRAVHELIYFRISNAIKYNAVVLILPLMFVVNLAKDVYKTRVLKIAQKALFIILTICLILLYLFRIGIYFKYF